MTALLRASREKPGIETYSTPTLMQWARTVASDLRTVATTDGEGNRVVAAKFAFRGETVVVTAPEERELAVQLVTRICELRGWRVPGSIPTRRQAELDIVGAMTSGAKDMAKAMIREYALGNEAARGYRGIARPIRPRLTDEDWKTSTAPKRGA